ncbi:MAG: peptide ABC transporter substrate-binding protein [Alphaproteobacteria bacterium]|nr:peptide ABC transporter substrate-binding protein [Alphaproteobacteria bacterium]
MRRVLLIILCLLLPAAARAAERADELSIGISQFPATFNPLIDPMVAKSYVLGMVRRPLTTYDANWQLVCMLCEALPSFANGLARKIALPDGKTGLRLTYTLKADARWDDGTPVTTDDVIFSWQVGRNPQTGVADAELYRRMIAVKAVDARTFTVDMDRVTFDYAALNDFEILPARVERAAFTNPAEYRIRSRYDTDPTARGLYDGPYRITEVSPGSHIVLERNPAWTGPRPYFSRIVVWAVENTASLEANLLAGGLDMAPGELGLPLDEALAFARRHSDAFNIIYKPGLEYEHIDINLDDPILADVRVRRALLYAVDRKAISQELFAGRDPVADSFVPALDWVYSADVPKYPYDQAKARALLDAAGWHATDGGVRRNAAGQPLVLTLATTAGNRSRELVEEVLQSQWRAVGIQVHLANQPARVLFGDSMIKRKFQMGMFAWSAAPEDVPRAELHSNEIPSPANNWSGENFVGWRNAEADHLLDAIETELDRPARAVLWRRLQALYAEELPALPLFFRAEPFILPKWLVGLTPTGHEYPSTLWIEQWRAVGRAAQARAP